MNHTEAEKEAQEHLELLTGMLEHVRHKGLVRWNPQTREEALEKFKMLDDIDAVLAPGSDPPFLMKSGSPRTTFGTLSTTAWSAGSLQTLTSGTCGLL